MNKPISVVYEDLKHDIADLINNSGLPPFVLESVIKDFLVEISDVAKRQYEYDKEQYDSSFDVVSEFTEKDFVNEEDNIETNGLHEK